LKIQNNILSKEYFENEKNFFLFRKKTGKKCFALLLIINPREPNIKLALAHFSLIGADLSLSALKFLG